jgi:aryl-alcohol dehydrogenase-like predicted oxidoreductase
MELRPLGTTGLRVSVLGFGCGNVGGLMIRGAPAERERAVARALELGINYFDTAALYGDGQSEINLGAALRVLGVRPLVGTKFAVPPGERDVAGAIRRALEASLRRLGMERVDVFYLHNSVGGGPRGISARQAIEQVAPALEALRREGKLGAAGFTANGDTDGLLAIADAGVFAAGQFFYNLLNPSAARPLPPGLPAQDYRQVLLRAGARGTGGVIVRVLAAGALSGVPERHPVAVPAVDPIGTGRDYAADLARAQALGALVREGHAGSLVEAALRFPLGTREVSTVLLGYSSQAHLEEAAAAVARGPLPAAALARLEALWAGPGEPARR